MCDNKLNKGFADRSKINMNEAYEKQYWKEKFDVIGQALAGAVEVVGTGAKEVEKYLKDKKK